MKKYILILIFFLPALLWAQDVQTVAERNAAQGFNDTIDRSAPDFVLVSLCVADPTDMTQDYLGVTGHAFLRLQCPTFNLDYCFSYESEKIKGQLLDYLTGKLKMGMFAIPTDDYIQDYRVWKRAVHEYRINMPPESEQRLWEQMDNHMLAEQDLQMDLIKFGCTNTLLRYVERALLPDTISYNWPEKFYTKSAMEIAEEHLYDYPWTTLGLRLTTSDELNRLRSPKQKVIFPNDLLEVWSLATINSEPMLTYIDDLVKAEPVVTKRPWFTPQLCAMLLGVLVLGLIIGLIVRKKIINHKS